jgi:hypothetical protein
VDVGDTGAGASGGAGSRAGAGASAGALAEAVGKHQAEAAAPK